jgi:hypothetical protein
LGRYEQRTRDARKKLNDYQSEIGRKVGYVKEQKELELQGTYIPTEAAGLRLSDEVQSQANLSGVFISVINSLLRQPSSGKTNAFFDEAAVTVNFRSGEKELVDFLWRLADKDTLVRAKSMQLGTDPARQNLQGTLTLVKSFPRKPPAKPTAVSPRAAEAGAKPATGAAPAAATAPKAPVTTGSIPVTKPTGAKPTTSISPAPGPTVSPIPAPMPTGGTNRSRRTMPAPAKP